MTFAFPILRAGCIASALALGAFAAEDYGPYSLMKHKGSELAPLGTFEKKVPAAIVAKVKAKEADIVAGKFTVSVARCA